MKELVGMAGRDDIVVESAALHTDEIGNDIHYVRRCPKISFRHVALKFPLR